MFSRATDNKSVSSSARPFLPFTVFSVPDCSVLVALEADRKGAQVL